jgi:predicted metal-dependent hydrolase
MIALWRLAAPKPPARPAVFDVDLDDAGRIPFTVRVHPRARRITLRLALDGASGRITLPPGASAADARDMIRLHREAIRERLGRMPARVPFADGASVPYQDVPHRIRHLADRARGCARGEGELRVGGPAAALSETLRRYLRADARAALGQRVAHHAERAGVRPRKICVRDTRSRWGSCAANGTLSFSWRLILAPAAALDYVAAHEVAHLVVPNHGPRFQALLRRLLAQTEGTAAGIDAADWLRRHGAGLHRYG